MLTSDLLRARLYKGTVRPQYLDAREAQVLEMARDLVELFRTHVGHTRGELDDALTELVGEGTDFLVYRGLAKLLFDRSDFVVPSTVPPGELRRHVFERSAKHHPVSFEAGDPLHPVTRAQVLADVAAELGLTSELVEQGLYADLEERQRLESFDPLEGEALVHRYNTALAQAVLLRASSLEIALAPGDPARFRQLFRFVKFYRLMFAVRGDWHAGYQLYLDGPASLFQQSSKYGLLMAEFLPALLLCEGWALRAEVLWGVERKPVSFELESKQGLRSHYRDTGVWVTEEETHFLSRLAATKTPWVAEKKPELYDLGGRGVLVPDLVLRHKEDGREVLLELVGFWRREYLRSRAQLLAEHGPPHLILAVSQRLRGDEEALEALPGAVVFFKDVLLVRDVLEQAEKVGRVPAKKAPEAPAKAPRKRKPKGAAAAE